MASSRLVMTQSHPPTPALQPLSSPPLSTPFPTNPALQPPSSLLHSTLNSYVRLSAHPIRFAAASSPRL